MKIGDRVIIPDGRQGHLVSITSKEYVVSVDGSGVESFDFVMECGDSETLHMTDNLLKEIMSNGD